MQKEFSRKELVKSLVRQIRINLELYRKYCQCGNKRLQDITLSYLEDYVYFACSMGIISFSKERYLKDIISYQAGLINIEQFK